MVTAQRSLTPRITAGPGQADARLAGSLVTTADLRAVPGVGNNVVATSINDATVFQDPDPRGPCGAKITMPSFTTGAGTAIQGAGLQGFEFVWAGPQATALFHQIIADTRTGCPPYSSTTNTGATERARLDEVLHVSGAAGNSTVTRLTISVGIQSVSGLMIGLRRNGRVALAAVFNASRLDDATIEALAQRMLRRLGS